MLLFHRNNLRILLTMTSFQKLLGICVTLLGTVLIFPLILIRDLIRFRVGLLKIRFGVITVLLVSIALLAVVFGIVDIVKTLIFGSVG